jgi:hypothetical protein
MSSGMPSSAMGASADQVETSTRSSPLPARSKNQPAILVPAAIHQRGLGAVRAALELGVASVQPRERAQ